MPVNYVLHCTTDNCTQCKNYCHVTYVSGKKGTYMFLTVIYYLSREAITSKISEISDPVAINPTQVVYSFERPRLNFQFLTLFSPNSQASDTRYVFHATPPSDTCKTSKLNRVNIASEYYLSVSTVQMWTSSYSSPELLCWSVNREPGRNANYS